MVDDVTADGILDSRYRMPNVESKRALRATTIPEPALFADAARQ